MKTISFALCLLFVACVTSELSEMPDILPKLIKQESFPPLPTALSRYRNDFDLKLLIGKDGSVLRAELLTTSGDLRWDSLALGRVYLWKFTPAIYKNAPVQIWTSIRASVRPQQPLYMGLAEIACGSSALADSLYTALQNGADFEMLATEFSVVRSHEHDGYLGQVDIHSYPSEVQEVLANLSVDEVAHPVKLDESYVIFKRVPWNIIIE